MKKALFILALFVSCTMPVFSFDLPNGNSSGKKIIIYSQCGNQQVRITPPTVVYHQLGSTITIDFGNQPIEDYTVTISSPFTDVDYYVTSSYTTIPLLVDGYSDYTIIIETCDGDVFEGTLAASDYTTTATI